MSVIALWALLVSLVGPAWAAQPAPVPSADLITAKDVKEQILPESDAKKRAEEEAEREEAERKRLEKLARVIVLKWNGRSTDFQDPVLQRNVRSRIARPDAQFFPDVDLYQNGRKVRDRTVVPAMQPAVVPEQNISRVLDAIDEIAALPERSLRPEAWGSKARELREMVELLWFVDRVELREPLFLLYAQIGRSAQFWDAGQPPFFEEIGGYPVNYYFYLAALLAYQDSTLMSKLTDDDVREAVGQLLTMLKQGMFPTFNLDFEVSDEDRFNLEEFSRTYEVLLNGLPLEELSEGGQYPVFFGRTDIYLRRQDSGHGLSERLEATKLEDKTYFVRDAARKKMGLDFIRQLFQYENECVPPLDGEILNYLSIYNKIHGNVDVYIAVPKYGNPNKVYIWRWDRERAQLQLVQGSGDSFPVRFAVLAGTGIMYSGAHPEVDTELNPSDVSGATTPDESQVTGRVSPNLKPAYVPIDFELRGHYNRLMVEIGTELGVNVGEEAQWIENYWLPGHEAGVVFQYDDVDAHVDADGALILNDNGEPVYYVEGAPVYNEQKLNRLIYITHAIVLGRDAAIGVGPRIGLQVGWSNLPHALVTQAHAGWTLVVPGFTGTGRVRPIVDIDVRGGTSFPFKHSMSHDEHQITVDPLFGLAAAAGVTF